nr:MAG TPA: hypothetical protein [Caudoviricetes sp.]DAR36999.1 MAG TPA: hypothetical protein [Caudoviricetes sp.]DAU88352.1 MAG TPA: hypothetical protein [Caudoviricetes sp.]DAZ43645.1 MAG TPA: hypothetical protein [Caudoviricetes sp.]
MYVLIYNLSYTHRIRIDYVFTFTLRVKGILFWTPFAICALLL